MTAFVRHLQSAPSPLRAYAELPGNPGCQTRMVLGLKCGAPTQVVSRTAEARERLRAFAFVGLTEEWATSVRLLYWTFGPEGAAPSPTELGPPTVRKTTYGHNVSAEEAQLSGWHDVADEALYAEARVLFESRRRAARAGGGMSVN